MTKEFLENTGLNPSDIKNYIYNNKKINPNLTIKEIGIKNNSEIIIDLKDKSIKFINIIFKISNNDEGIKIKCLKKEKFTTLIRRFKIITTNEDKCISFVFDLKEIDDLDTLKQEEASNKSLEELGLKDNSIIYYTDVY